MRRLPGRSDGPQHRAVYDPGGGAGKCERFPMVRGLFPCFAEGWRSRARSMMAMAKGEGMGCRSLPTGQGILERNSPPPAQNFVGNFL